MKRMRSEEDEEKEEPPRGNVLTLEPDKTVITWKRGEERQRILRIQTVFHVNLDDVEQVNLEAEKPNPDEKASLSLDEAFSNTLTQNDSGQYELKLKLKITPPPPIYHGGKEAKFDLRTIDANTAKRRWEKYKREKKLVEPHGCWQTRNEIPPNAELYDHIQFGTPPNKARVMKHHFALYQEKKVCVHGYAEEHGHTVIEVEVSHLCGNSYCWNPDHMFIELTAINNRRKECHKDPSRPCNHVPPCLR
jgi:hypothetical protein